MLLSLRTPARALAAAAAKRSGSAGATRSAGTLSSSTGSNFRPSSHRVSAAPRWQRQQHQPQHQPMPTQQRPIVVRSFSTKIVDIRRSEQRNIWSAYLSGSISDATLFTSIDLNRSNTISVQEIDYFLDSVDRSGLDQTKFELLQRLGNDHLLDKNEFRRWLRMATDVADDGSGFAIDDSSSSSSSSDSSDDERGTASSASASGSGSGKKVVDARRGLQSMVWDLFLSEGKHAPELFKMIDLNRGKTISVQEITYFINSIGGKGVDPGSLDMLKSLGEDREMDEEEFYCWLGDATGVELSEEGERLTKGVERDSTNADGCVPGQW